jgi:hypothetical protein
MGPILNRCASNDFRLKRCGSADFRLRACVAPCDLLLGMHVELPGDPVQCGSTYPIPVEVTDVRTVPPTGFRQTFFLTVRGRGGRCTYAKLHGMTMWSDLAGDGACCPGGAGMPFLNGDYCQGWAFESIIHMRATVESGDAIALKAGRSSNSYRSGPATATVVSCFTHDAAPLVANSADLQQLVGRSYVLPARAAVGAVSYLCWQAPCDALDLYDTRVLGYPTVLGGVPLFRVQNPALRRIRLRVEGIHPTGRLPWGDASSLRLAWESANSYGFGSYVNVFNQVLGESSSCITGPVSGLADVTFASWDNQQRVFWLEYLGPAYVPELVFTITEATMT